MTLYRLETSQVLPVSLPEAWRFFTDPRNLARITPSDMAFEVTTPLPPQIYPGLLIAYRLRPLLGIPVEWVTEITHVVEEAMFVDEQRAGPYALWHHEHVLRPVTDGTEVRDTVFYMLPFGRLGALARQPVRRRLRQIFDHRRLALRALFGEIHTPANRTSGAVLAVGPAHPRMV
jgi:ligand-binding SRPBCC domain-containing protein